MTVYHISCWNFKWSADLCWSLWCHWPQLRWHFSAIFLFSFAFWPDLCGRLLYMMSMFRRNCKAFVHLNSIYHISSKESLLGCMVGKIFAREKTAFILWLSCFQHLVLDSTCIVLLSIFRCVCTWTVAVQFKRHNRILQLFHMKTRQVFARWKAGGYRKCVFILTA